MSWFAASSEDYPFEMFTFIHWFMIGLVIIGAIYLFLSQNTLKKKNLRKLEYILAISLLTMEALYHLWMYVNGIWLDHQSLPLELCSISLILTILLLWTKNKTIYELLLFTSILGASQALLTPVLDIGFPHFRFFHFFFTHMMMIWVALYFTWIHGYRPTIFSVIKVVLFLNILLPFIIFINKITGGNYMFLSRKPTSASLLDFLGPYPFYIISLEVLLVILSLLLWILFREKHPK